ncbi:response regulator transcription factor [Planctobacterium marinum]|uniref:DNA-binding response regulator n=1 Tax=Planctobacterium marinum TaxID=1631968 RepID=A0AA48HQX5_9ALTE|nr:DNA-binding response regulator [Planctobacterium marinum]
MTIFSQPILVVEDNHTTAKTLSIFLNGAGYEVNCVANGSEALIEFHSKPYALILLDIMMPGIDGLTVCQKIRQTSDIPIVMLTAKSSEDDIVNGLESGANDYVCKPFGAKELIARIKNCLRNAKALESTPALIELGSIMLAPEQRKVWLNQEELKLTKSEYSILYSMIQQVGRVFTREQLINQALGEQYEGFERTIDTHIWSLRKKLKEPKGQPRYLHSEMGIGYRLEDVKPETNAIKNGESQTTNQTN